MSGYGAGLEHEDKGPQIGRGSGRAAARCFWVRGCMVMGDCMVFPLGD